LGEVVEPRELAKRYHQLAEQCYRLAAIASEPAVSEGFIRMGDGLAAKANHLEAKDGPGSQTRGGDAACELASQRARDLMAELWVPRTHGSSDLQEYP